MLAVHHDVLYTFECHEMNTKSQFRPRKFKLVLGVISLSDKVKPKVIARYKVPHYIFLPHYKVLYRDIRKKS